MSLLLKGTIGRVMYIWRKSFRCSNAQANASNVLPVPALPCIVTNLISGFNNASIANDCSALRGKILNTG